MLLQVFDSLCVICIVVDWMILVIAHESYKEVFGIFPSLMQSRLKQLVADIFSNGFETILAQEIVKSL